MYYPCAVQHLHKLTQWAGPHYSQHAIVRSCLHASRQNVSAIEQFTQCIKVNVEIHRFSDQQRLEPSYWILLLCLLDFQLHVFTTSLSWNTGFLIVPSSPIWVPIRSSKHDSREILPSAPQVVDIPGVVRGTEREPGKAELGNENQSSGQKLFPNFLNNLF